MKAKTKTTKAKLGAKSIKVVDAELGKMDVVFIIDTTGSMGSYIQEAKDRAVSVLTDLEKTGDLNMRVALIAYRDHPPQDITYITKRFDFSKIDQFQSNLNQLDANGGGDRPEAVWPAVNDLSLLKWRKNSERLVYLIGDSPPHGYTAYGNAAVGIGSSTVWSTYGSDAWPQGDPSGINHEQLIKLLKEFKIKLNAHSIANHKDTTDAFTLLTKATDGEISVGDRAQDSTTLYTTSISARSGLIADAKALYANTVVANGSYTTGGSATTAAELGWDTIKTATAVEYLKARGITD